MRIKFLFLVIFFWIASNIYANNLVFRKQILNSNADVSISSPANGQLLKYNGSNWENWTSNYLTSESDPIVGAINGIVEADGAGNISANSELTDWIDDVTLGSSGALTLPVGQNFTIGATQWNSGDEIDGTKVANADLGDISVSGGSWTLDNGVVDNAAIADDTIAEGKLDIYNAPTNGYYLKYDSTNGMEWATVSGGSGATYREITLLPSSAILDDDNPPALPIVESTGTGTSRFRVADFDSATDEIIYFSFVMPSDYTASFNIILDIYWFANATSGTCVWEAAISATTEADADTPLEESCATSNTASEAVNGTEANRLIKTTLTISNLDSVAAGDTVVLRFNRDADNGSDDLSPDARLRAIHVKIPRS